MCTTFNVLPPALSLKVIQILILLFLSYLTLTVNSQKKEHSFDLNKTATSDSTGETGTGDVEVQSRFIPHVPASIKRPRSSRGKKRLREEEVVATFNPNHKQPKNGPFRFSKPGYLDKNLVLGLTEDGECETHKVGCPHWRGLNTKERRLHSNRLSHRRRQTLEENRQKNSKQSLKWYFKLNKDEKKKRSKHQREREKKRFYELPKHIQEEKKKKVSIYGKAYREGKKAVEELF